MTHSFRKNLIRKNIPYSKTSHLTTSGLAEPLFVLVSLWRARSNLLRHYQFHIIARVGHSAVDALNFEIVNVK